MQAVRWQALAVVLGAGALAAAFPKPDLHLFVWFAVVPLLRAAERSGPWTALRYGLLFGMVFRAGNLYWIVHAMTRFGGLPLPVAMVAAGLLMAYLAAYWGLFALVVQQVGLRSIAALAWIAACWTGLEYFQSWFLSGFPWTPVGYAAGHSSLMVQVAALGGVYALSFLAMLTNAALAAWTLRGRPARAQLAVVAALLAVVAIHGSWVLHGAVASSERLAVGLVQGNVAQDSKWDVETRREILDRHLELTREAAAAGAELVLWPESSWPDPYGIERDPAAYSQVSQVSKAAVIDVVVGTVRVRAAEEGYDVANAAVMVDAQGEIAGAYEKIHLVPFGEYLPLQSALRWLGPLVQAVGSLRPGSPDQDLLGSASGPRLAVPAFGMSICYEIIFPRLARQQVAQGARFLATITNDAWYGSTSGPYQHFAMARLRAVENRRWLVRAANTGISGAVDPWGRVVAATELETVAAPVVQIGLRDDTTLYQRTGDAFAIVCQVIALLAVAAALRSRPVLKPPPDTVTMRPTDSRENQ